MLDVRSVAIRQVLRLVCGFMFYAPNLLKNPEAYVYVDQVVEDPERYAFANLMVHGYVVAGSITEGTKAQTAFRTFRVVHEGREIRVNHTGPKPPTFRDLSSVEARGRLVKRDGEYQLDAVELYSSTYYGCFKGTRRIRFDPDLWLGLSEERHSLSE